MRPLSPCGRRSSVGSFTYPPPADSRGNQTAWPPPRSFGPGPDTTPRWDSDSNCLWVGNVLVKRLRFDATHQREVLAWLEEQDWKEVVVDPLPAGRCRDRKVRVRETVRALNRGQAGPLRVVFHAARDVLGYRWELIRG